MRKRLYKIKVAVDDETNFLIKGQWIYGYPVYDYGPCMRKDCECKHGGEMFAFLAWIDSLHEYDYIQPEVLDETTLRECTELYLLQNSIEGLSVITSYKETILAFAENNMKPQKAAHALCLDTNTINYRFKMIRKASGLNPKNFYDLITLVRICGGDI